MARQHHLENAPRPWQAKVKQGEDALSPRWAWKLNAIKLADPAAIGRIVGDPPPGGVALFLRMVRPRMPGPKDSRLCPIGSGGENATVLPFVREALANVYVLEDEAQAANA